MKNDPQRKAEAYEVPRIKGRANLNMAGSLLLVWPHDFGLCDLTADL